MVRSIDDLQEGKVRRAKPFPKMGPCAAATQPKRQRLRPQTSSAGLSPLPRTENREGRSFRICSDARWGSSGLAVSPVLVGGRGGLCMCEVRAAAACCLLLLPAGHCCPWFSGHCLNASRKKTDQCSTLEWWPGPGQLCTGDRWCEIHSETVLDCKMQPLMKRSPPVPRGKQKKASAFHWPHLPCENRRKVQEASA